MSLTKLKEIVFDRIPVEIFLAHEALGVYMAIAEGADSLNRFGHRQVFGIIQRQAFGAFILSLCKLFEKPSNEYPNYGIRTALVHLGTVLNNMAVPVPDQSVIKLDEYIRTKIDSTFNLIDPLEAATAARMVHAHFEEECPRTPPREKKLDVTLDALKVLRDKRVAHHEDNNLEGLTKTDMDDAIELLCFAQTFVNIVGAFFGFSLKSIAKPTEFATDRSESGIQMKNMIKKLE